MQYCNNGKQVCKQMHKRYKYFSFFTKIVDFGMKIYYLATLTGGDTSLTLKLHSSMAMLLQVGVIF
jgi:hypothetical protein